MNQLPVRTLGNSRDGKPMSRFEMELLSSNKDGVKVEAHRHDYYHILFVKNGTGRHNIDFKTYDIRPNSIFFISPGQVHSIQLNHSAEAYVLTFTSDFILLDSNIQRLLDYPFFHSISNRPYVYVEGSNHKIQQTLDEMYVESKMEKKGRDKILRALLEVLLIRVRRIYEPALKLEAPNHLSYQLRKLEALIDKHYKEYKQLTEYADLMHISAKHLNSLCKKGLNKTVLNLIHERTLIEAKRLLLFTNNTISEIAYELGFADKSYFMRFFKKHTSLTADAFRKKNNAKQL
ncbi:AraC family transcriptional regulator [Marinifilum caeruleilacunae]|uniref:Helix-turn-helix domain-containing protein n=1 Tax=Marinifilum caeruleilacunae TaxID=2499076 RepID=A0ABX1WTV6_9BACT|nr:AraC family transcriptional regulator [Marinifilum caeruleilacunae]NOU59523.1 helix-turn-helix domain-containing protein [Marinifilum caeruleilacunae]